MKYIIKRKGIVVETDKRWLVRHNYSKLAVKAYGYLCKASDVSDATLATLCKVSPRAYQDAKRELVYAGLLEVHKVNADTLVYLIGDKAIESSIRGLKDKESNRLVRKSLESIGLYEELVEEDEVITDLYSAQDIANLKERIPTPKPIDFNLIF